MEGWGAIELFSQSVDLVFSYLYTCVRPMPWQSEQMKLLLTVSSLPGWFLIRTAVLSGCSILMEFTGCFQRRRAMKEGVSAFYSKPLLHYSILFVDDGLFVKAHVI